MRNRRDLVEAVYYGAVRRLRPKVMAAVTTIAGLVPIMWAATSATGADVMKRMATPMVGGLVTSVMLELAVFPVIFYIWKGMSLKEREE